MAEQAIDTLIAVGKASEDRHKRPNLCMTWAVDPMTGKLTAYWVAERAEPARNAGLNSAA